MFKTINKISDPEDILNVKILELTALKDIRSFLTYLLNSTWSYSDKQVFIDKYLAQIEEITINLFRDVAGADQEEIEFESTRVNYLNKLVAEREANLREYMPLAYKADDGSAQVARKIIIRGNVIWVYALPHCSAAGVKRMPLESQLAVWNNVRDHMRETEHGGL